MLFRAQGKTLDDPQWVSATGCGGNPTCDPTSFNTQPTYVVPVTPTHGDPYFLYMADNWGARELCVVLSGAQSR